MLLHSAGASPGHRGSVVGVLAPWWWCTWVPLQRFGVAQTPSWHRTLMRNAGPTGPLDVFVDSGWGLWACRLAVAIDVAACCGRLHAVMGSGHGQSQCDSDVTDSNSRERAKAHM